MQQAASRPVGCGRCHPPAKPLIVQSALLLPTLPPGEGVSPLFLFGDPGSASGKGFTES